MTLTMVFVCGIVVGALCSNIIRIVETASGTLKIDQTNPKKDVYRLEVESLDVLAKKKRVVLKIDTKAKLSQK